MANGAGKVEDDVTSLLMCREASDATRRKAAPARMELKDVLRRASTRIEIELQAAILRDQTELERSDSEVFCNVGTCRAVLHNCGTDVRRSFPDRSNSVAAFVADIVVAEPGQAEDAE